MCQRWHVRCMKQRATSRRLRDLSLFADAGCEPDKLTTSAKQGHVQQRATAIGDVALRQPDGIDLDQLHQRARLLQKSIRLGDLYNQAEPTTTQMSLINKSALRPSRNAFTRTTGQLPDCRRVAGNVRCKASSTTESRHALHINHPHHRDTDAHTSCVRLRRPSGQRRRKSLRCTRTAKETTDASDWRRSTQSASQG